MKPDKASKKEKISALIWSGLITIAIMAYLFLKMK